MEPTFPPERAAQDRRRIETQHQLQTEEFTAVLNAMRRDGDRDLIRCLLTGLLLSTEAHFRTEEDAAFNSGFPYAAEHALDHRAMARSLATIEETFEAGRVEEAAELLATLDDWLRNHTQVMDESLEDYLAEKANPEG